MNEEFARSFCNEILHSFSLDEGKFSKGCWHWLNVLSDINREVNHACVSFVCGERYFTIIFAVDMLNTTCIIFGPP